MATIFIDGEAGTTGLQIREKLEGVPGITLASLPPEARKDPAAKKKIYEEADVVILCLPDEAAKEAAKLIDSMGDKAPRVIDASSAHRVAPGWTYGFPELTPGQDRGHRQGEEGHQSGLPRHRRDRALAAARRRRPPAEGLAGHDHLGQRLFRRRQVDDRGLRDGQGRRPSSITASRSSTSTCRRSSSTRA